MGKAIEIFFFSFFLHNSLPIFFDGFSLARLGCCSLSLSLSFSFYRFLIHSFLHSLFSIAKVGGGLFFSFFLSLCVYFFSFVRSFVGALIMCLCRTTNAVHGRVLLQATGYRHFCLHNVCVRVHTNTISSQRVSKVILLSLFAECLYETFRGGFNGVLVLFLCCCFFCSLLYSTTSTFFFLCHRFSSFSYIHT